MTLLKSDDDDDSIIAYLVVAGDNGDVLSLCPRMRIRSESTSTCEIFGAILLVDEPCMLCTC
jgi:hypothetical protein